MAKKEKRFTWLQLGKDFFLKKKVKKMRRLKNGATYVLIYIEMLTKSLEEDGYLIFEGVEETFSEELALELDEETEDVEETVKFLLKNNLMEEREKEENYAEYFLPEAMELTGGETASARRVRRFREKQKLKEENSKKEGKEVSNQTKTLQCNGVALQCNAQPLQKSKSVTPCNKVKQKCNTELELELELEKELEIRDRVIVRENENPNNNLKEYLFSLELDPSSTKNILKLLKEKDKGLDYLKEKVSITEARTKGGISKNVGYLVEAVKEDYSNFSKDNAKTIEAAPVKKTRFHNFEESSRRDYTDEQLNGFITNRKRKA